MLGAFRLHQYRRLAGVLAGVGHPLPELEQIRDWPDIWVVGA